MKRYKELLEEGVRILEVADIENAGTDAWILFEHIFHITRAQYYMDPYHQAIDELEADYREALALRQTHIPVQHITGEQEFMGLTFHVDSHVLIPRQDTEILVEHAIALIKACSHKAQYKVLDMCTGSGCIAISLARLCGLKDVSGADISKEALTIARENAKNNEVEQITWILSDLFNEIEHKYDMIISNPPYIPTGVINSLMTEVKEHDPMLALDGAADGLAFYRRITAVSMKFLEEDGVLLYEIGHDQGEAVRSILVEQGFADVKVCKDLAGLDRVVIAKTSV